MISDSAFIFHMYIPCSKTFSFVPRSRSPVKVSMKYQCHIFQKWLLRGHSCFTNTFCLLLQFEAFTDNNLKSLKAWTLHLKG